MRASVQVSTGASPTATMRSSSTNPARAAAESGSGVPTSGATPLMPIISTSQ